MHKAHASERWISDGNFAQATFDIRLQRATLLIWVEHSRLVCATRVIRRVFRRGEPHRIGRIGNVLRFIWRFNRVNRPLIEAARLRYGPDVPVMRLIGNHDIESFLSNYEEAWR